MTIQLIRAFGSRCAQTASPLLTPVAMLAKKVKNATLPPLQKGSAHVMRFVTAPIVKVGYGFADRTGKAISTPVIAKLSNIEQSTAKILHAGRKNTADTLDKGLIEVRDCARSAKKLIKTVRKTVQLGAELAGFVTGLYVFNCASKNVSKARPFGRVQQIAGVAIAGLSGLHWLRRMAKSHIAPRLLPSFGTGSWAGDITRSSRPKAN